MLLVVWIVVGVLAVAVLGALLHTVLGAVQRLRREVEAADREARPVLEEVKAALDRAAAAAEQRGSRR